MAKVTKEQETAIARAKWLWKGGERSNARAILTASKVPAADWPAEMK